MCTEKSIELAPGGVELPRREPEGGEKGKAYTYTLLLCKYTVTLFGKCTLNLSACTSILKRFSGLILEGALNDSRRSLNCGGRHPDKPYSLRCAKSLLRVQGLH